MKRQRKKRYRFILGLCLLAALLCFLVIWFITSVPKAVKIDLITEAEATAGLNKLALKGSDWVQVADNGALELLVRPDTAEVAVRDTLSGRMFYTNPQDRDSDTVARGANASLIHSQLEVSCADQKNNITQISSYSLAVQNGQVGYYALDDGLKVFYTMSEKTEELLLPSVVTYDEFVTYFTSLITNSKDRRKIQEGYMPVFFEPEKLTDEERSAITTIYGSKPFMTLSFDEKADYIAKYPLIEEVGNCFILNVSGYKATSLNKILAGYEFTLDDKYRLESAIGVVHEEQFTVTASLEYRLDGDQLTVTAPASDVTCTDGYRVTGLWMLPMFAASRLGTDGYALLPDGSGAIVRFSEQPRPVMAANISIYGTDPSTTNSSSIVKSQPAMLPAYGIVSGDQAVLALLESGESLATLNLSLAGRIHSYNTVFPEFVIAANTQITLQAVASDTAVRTYQLNPYRGDFTVRYFLLWGGEANYSAMAAKLRDYWIARDVFQQERRSAGDYALTVELLMGIDKVQPVFGFPVKKVTAMTTFAQAETFMQRMEQAGVDRMLIKLRGWQEGGSNHGLQTGASANAAVGGNGAMAAFLAAADAHGHTVYPSFGATTIDVEKDTLLDGFNVSADVVQTLRREPSRFYQYNIATGILDRLQQMRFQLTTAKRLEVAQAYARALEPLRWNIAFEELGSVVGTDFNPRQPVNRDTAQDRDAQVIAMLSQNRLSMGDAVNAYAYPWIGYIAQLPSASSLWDIYDASVPFVQMVLHGYRGYSIEYLNVSDISREQMLLRILETGSDPAFLWIAETDDQLLDTDYQSLYSLSYEQWVDVASSLYLEASAVLAPLSGQVIKEHEWLTPEVACVTYEDGTRILINYGCAPYQDGTVDIPATDYLVIAGGAQ